MTPRLNPNRIGLVLALACLTGCVGNVPVRTPASLPAACSAPRTRDAILDAAHTERWAVESVTVGRVKASWVHGKRLLQAAITYDDRHVRVEYLRSERLRESASDTVATAHPMVNARLEQLESRVKAALANAPCETRVVVVSSVGYQETAAPAPEITTTPAYEHDRTRYERVAVFGPHRCTDETAAQLSGEQVGPASTVAQTTCGTAIADVERALSEQGYEVVSSRALVASENMARSEHGPLGIAAKHRVQVVFQINSLERLDAGELTIHARHKRQYFQADQFWRPAVKLPMPADEIASIEQMIGERQPSREGPPGAMLDVTALDPATGRTLFMYRHKLVKFTSRGGERHIRLIRVKWPTGQVGYRWPERRKAARDIDGPPNAQASISFETSVPAGRTDQFRRAQACLIRSLIADMAHRFRTGERAALSDRACGVSADVIAE